MKSLASSREEGRVEITRRHNMTKGQAKVWIDRKLSDLPAETVDDWEHHWAGDVLQFRGTKSGVSVTGSLSVTESQFMLNLSLSLPGLAALFFEGKAEGKARAGIERWLDENLPR